MKISCPGKSDNWTDRRNNQYDVEIGIKLRSNKYQNNIRDTIIHIDMFVVSVTKIIITLMTIIEHRISLELEK